MLVYRSAVADAVRALEAKRDHHARAAAAEAGSVDGRAYFHAAGAEYGLDEAIRVVRDVLAAGNRFTGRQGGK